MHNKTYPLFHGAKQCFLLKLYLHSFSYQCFKICRQPTNHSCFASHFARVILLLVYHGYKQTFSPLTGRCKSTFHQFLNDVMDSVQVKALAKGHAVKSVFMPHCTWDKFGDILANAGGRSFGLFDELVPFFSTMNMYSTSKMQLSDTKEYQDFLQLFTGKSKTRETSKLRTIF